MLMLNRPSQLFECKIFLWTQEEWKFSCYCILVHCVQIFCPDDACIDKFVFAKICCILPVFCRNFERAELTEHTSNDDNWIQILINAWFLPIPFLFAQRHMTLHTPLQCFFCLSEYCVTDRESFLKFHPFIFANFSPLLSHLYLGFFSMNWPKLSAES